MSLPALDKSSVFLLEALVVWMALCLPGNIVTLVLYNRANSGDDGAAAEADQEVSKGQKNIALLVNVQSGSGTFREGAQWVQLTELLL